MTSIVLIRRAEYEQHTTGQEENADSGPSQAITADLQRNGG